MPSTAPVGEPERKLETTSVAREVGVSVRCHGPDERIRGLEVVRLRVWVLR